MPDRDPKRVPGVKAIGRRWPDRLPLGPHASMHSFVRQCIQCEATAIARRAVGFGYARAEAAGNGTGEDGIVDAGSENDGRWGALAALRGKHDHRGGAADVAYWTIRDAIRTGVIRPGARLVELDLAAALEMSRTPVREALRRLDVERLVEHAPRRGYLVPTVTLEELVEIFEIREVLEGLAARRAAQRMAPAEIDALRTTVERMEQARDADDLTLLAEASVAFHRVLRSGSRHARLPTLIGVLGDSHPSFGAHELAPERVGPAVAEHRAIYEAIAARDPDAAETLTREHARHALGAQILAHHLAGHE